MGMRKNNVWHEGDQNEGGHSGMTEVNAGIGEVKVGLQEVSVSMREVKVDMREVNVVLREVKEDTSLSRHHLAPFA